MALAVFTLAAGTSSAAITEIGGPGVGNGTFDVAGAVAVDTSGDVYVLDPHRGTLQKFSNTGSFIAAVGTVGGKPLKDPEGIAIDGSNDVFVADTGNGRLVELNSSLEYIGTPVEEEYVSVATGVCGLLEPCLYTLGVTGSEYRAEALSYTGTLLHTHTFADGSGPGELAAPNANPAIHDQLAVDAAGTVFVTDADNQRVIELNAELDPLAPQLTGLTGYAQGIGSGEVGGSIEVYVGDDNYAGVASVRRFSPEGALLGAVTVGGAHGGLATDTAGDVFDGEGFSGGGVLRIDTTPDPAIAAVPSGGLTSQTVTFDAAATEIDLWGAADYRWDLDGSGTYATDTATTPTVSRQFNAPGVYPIGLRVTATSGLVAQTTIDYDVGSSSASFTGPPSALSGTAVEFDAASSAIPYSSIADYAWDFDGSGSYAVDGGASPTISHAFLAPGTYKVQLRVTRTGGRVDFATGTITVAPLPPPGPVGVSIDRGDYATNDPHVQLDLIWPAGAENLLVSNDGGFGVSGATMTLGLAPQVPWTLEQTGPERLPKTVYVRFLGAGMDTQNFTDDIILDQRPPLLESASLGGGGAAAVGAQASAKRAPRAHGYRVRLRARDTFVGICAVDASVRRSGGTVTNLVSCRRRGILRLSRTVTVKATSKPTYIRVRNSAGSWSRWVKLR